MIETALVLTLLALLAGAGWAAVLLDWQSIAAAGAVLAAVAFLFGVPAGFYYHVLLYRCLKPRGVLPTDWYWRPTRYHEHLMAHERPGVMAYFYVGGVGFLLIIIGCAGCLFGLLLAP